MRVFVVFLGILGLGVALLLFSAPSDTGQASTGSMVMSATNEHAEGDNSTSKNPSRNLGGGYKSAKWGMSEAEVKKALADATLWRKDELREEPLKEFRVYYGEETRLYCKFYKNQLYEVENFPFGKGYDEAGNAFELLAARLEKKFGRGEHFKSTRLSITKSVNWDDGETRIELLKDGETTLLETFFIVYYSKSIKKQIENDREAARARAKKDQQDRIDSAISDL